MDLNAYHRAWMNGATEAEAVRAGEDACFENIAYAAQERAAYEAMERDAYEHEQRLIAEHEANAHNQAPRGRVRAPPKVACIVMFGSVIEGLACLSGT